MAVDAQGLILTVAEKPIQDSFLAVIDGVCQGLILRFEGLIHSIYLYGSVAEGRAVAFKSDLDVSIILNRQPRLAERAGLDQLQLELQVLHPIVSKIDFDLGTLDDVRAPQGKLSWGYWLKHHCRCIYGNDLSRDFQKFKPCRDIAIAVNGDFHQVLNLYLTRINAASCITDIMRLQREAARKLIRSTNVLRQRRDNDWPDTLEQYVAKFIERYPEQAAEIGIFLANASSEFAYDPDFSARLSSFNQWMEKEFQKSRLL